jgi:hypothetical protein
MMHNGAKATGSKGLAGNSLVAQQIQVAVSVQDAGTNLNVSVDPWDNCPSEIAREEGRLCNECECWGREVQGVDWSEFSLCSFNPELEAGEDNPGEIAVSE